MCLCVTTQNMLEYRTIGCDVTSDMSRNWMCDTFVECRSLSEDLTTHRHIASTWGVRLGEDKEMALCGSDIRKDTK